jgi:hypothetical protein
LHTPTALRAVRCLLFVGAFWLFSIGNRKSEIANEAGCLV